MTNDLMLHDFSSINGRSSYVNIEIANSIYSTEIFITPKSFFEPNLDEYYKKEIILILDSFFKVLLKSIIAGNEEKLEELRIHLHEPKYVNLGYGKVDDGKGFSKIRFYKMCNSIKESKGFKTGLIRDISDISLFCSGIGEDLTSDLIVSLIFPILSNITLNELRISKVEGIFSSKIQGIHAWNRDKKEWDKSPTALDSFTYNGHNFLFVPLTFCLNEFSSSSVRNKYFKDYILKEIAKEMKIRDKKLSQKEAIKYFCATYLNEDYSNSLPTKEQFLHMIDKYAEALKQLPSNATYT